MGGGYIEAEVKTSASISLQGESPPVSNHLRHHMRYTSCSLSEFPGSERLSSRQREVMELLAHGCQNKEIATTLRISLSTVATHMGSIFEKLQVSNRAHAVAIYVQSVRRSGIPAANLETSRLGNLSSRQREVLEMLRTGRRNKDINEVLGVSVLTVNTHVRRICQRLRVRSRAEAVAVYTQSLFASPSTGRTPPSV